MSERDYEGDMKYFQDQLLKKGITKEMLDMNRFIGCTFSELQRIVDSAYIIEKGDKKK